MVSFKLYVVGRYYFRVDIYDTMKDLHSQLKILYTNFPYKFEKDRRKDLRELNKHQALTLWCENITGKNNLGVIVFCKDKLDLRYIAHELQHALIFAAKKLRVDLKMLGKRRENDEKMAYAAGRITYNFFVELFKRKVLKNDYRRLKGKRCSR